MKIKVRTISFSITILAIVVLITFIILGTINYVPLEGDNTTVIFRTVSEIIDNHPSNMAIYLMFVTVYGSIKMVLIVLSSLDIEILQSELIERQAGIVSNNVKSLFIQLSYITSLLAIFQIFTMILLVFVPISKVYAQHMLVAALSFGSALVKSFFYLVRRKLIYKTSSFFFISNVLYWLGLLASAICFYIWRYGLIEYLLVLFILMENFFLVFELFNLDFIYAVKLESEIRDKPRITNKRETDGLLFGDVI